MIRYIVQCRVFWKKKTKDTKDFQHDAKNTVRNRMVHGGAVRRGSYKTDRLIDCNI